MQLTLTFSNGTTTTVPFSTASTLQVSTDTEIQGSWTSVASLELADDPVEVVDGPAQIVLEPPAATSGAPADETPAVVTEPTSGDGSDAASTVTVLADGTQIDGTGTSNPTVTTTTDDPALAPAAPVDVPVDVPPPADVAPVDAPVEPQSVGEALAAADPPADVTEPTDADVVPAPQADTPAPDEAVAAVNDGIDTAVAASAPDQEAHLATLQADIDQLLAQYPDDTRLQDAKAQAADLAADLSAELG